MLKRKNFLTIDFSPCYSNGKLRPFGGIQIGRIGPFHRMEYFYYLFRNFLHGDTDEKVDLGNNERPSVPPPKCALNIYTTAFSTIHYSSL